MSTGNLLAGMAIGAAATLLLTTKSGRKLTSDASAVITALAKQQIEKIKKQAGETNGNA